LRPSLTVLLVFVLLLANLAQLQPGVVESHDLFSKVSEPFAFIQKYRTPFVWVSLWPAGEMWHYAAIVLCGLWAAARIWPQLPRVNRWLFVALPLCGILSVPLSVLLLEHERWSLASVIQPARCLLYCVAFASVACALAGAHAAHHRKYGEAFLWFIPVAAIPINAKILDLFRISNWHAIAQFGYVVVLAAMLAGLLRLLSRTRWKSFVLLIPAGALFAVPALDIAPIQRAADETSIRAAADWATANTWGSSMFLFPDAGRDLYPGVFRVLSLRALWVDWQSGALVPYFESFAAQWWPRWEETMDTDFSPRRIENLLSLPVDYYVLRRSHELLDVRAVFRNREFVIYDAADLRKARVPLKTVDTGN